jgi:hypothetical protein
MGMNRFDGAAINALSGFLTQASTIPMFMSANVAVAGVALPASVLLLAGGVATKIIGGWAENLIDRRPIFSKRNVRLDFNRAGTIPPVANFKVVVEDDVSENFIAQYSPDEAGVVRDKMTGKQYDGDEPYMVLSLDGRANEKYAGFVPTAAGAELLDKFLAMGNEGSLQNDLDLLLEGLKLASDSKFRIRAEKLATQLERLQRLKQTDSEEYKEILAEYEAMVANIQDERLKPPELA